MGTSIKNLPDEQTLLELLQMAKEAEEEAKALCDLATEIDEKWRLRLEKRKQKQIEASQV